MVVLRSRLVRVSGRFYRRCRRVGATPGPDRGSTRPIT